MNKFLIAAVSGLMIAGPSFAQTAETTPETTPAAPAVEPAPAPAADPAAPTADPAAPAADPAAPAASTMAEPETAIKVPEGYTMTELMTVTGDELKGVDIYDMTDSKIAEIADVQIGPDSKVNGIVTDVGGFLGLGEHRILLAPDQISVYKNADNDIRAYVSMTKDELKALPEYEEPAAN
ncbi:PRC-barrel domain-containing protein [Paracoccus sulfuroxidans]|uniref:PRC-barrel domain protein n=1 Tax=Paracoccus sulfuroxidans TaxID=384678 RepID=A0A562NP80_9RHOB|nr:PRC-barrel domain-containing protein [Paracoccus sulfuroxidans]TWI33943.1 PRC-barrel domain protein [Paracoccus sulfuroxidans]